MVYDKANGNPAHSSRPLMPTVATNRAVKSPITPRLATHATPPLSRKSTQNSISSVLKSGTPKDDLSTPVKAFLSGNVTPRSSSRKSRVESAQSTPGPTTPNTTPIGLEQRSVNDSTKKRDVGNVTPSGARSLEEAVQKRPRSLVGGHGPGTSPLVCSLTRAAGRGKPSVTSPSVDKGMQFFRAKDIRAPDLTPTPRKPATFVFANGQEEAPQTGSTSPALSALSVKSSRSQFFHADGTIEEDDVPPLRPLPKHVPEPVPLQVDGATSPSTVSPASPRPLENFHLSYRKGVSQILRPGNHRPPIPQVPTSVPSSTLRQRSASIDPVSSKKHARTSSLSSIESSPSRRISGKDSDSRGLIRTSSPALCPPAESRAPAPAPAEVHENLSRPPSGALLPSRTLPLLPNPAPLTPSSEVSDPLAIATTVQDRPKRSSLTISVPQSPTKIAGATGQNVAHLAELAANARRERKVLDLEISNSSLLAINRQLEREVRKQKAELRRYRRLTRAGRLSAASMMHVPLESDNEDDHAVDAEGLNEGLAELSEDDCQSDGEDVVSTCASSVDSIMLSPSALAERDAKKLEKDSKRLQIDLTRHRQLLVDSQKMNQSLKRCMAWTEEMIREGKKQLDYRVRVSDVRLGGRVLDREASAENEEVSAQDHSLLNAWSPTSLPDSTADYEISGPGVMVQRNCWQSEDDSGVEVESTRTSGATKALGPCEATQPAPHRLSYEYALPEG